MFNLSPTLNSTNLILRPLVAQDFDSLYLCAGDRRVWRSHPKSNRYKKDEFEKWFSQALNYEHTLVIVKRDSREIIGSTRFYYDEPLTNSIFIGFTFLAFNYWGSKYQGKSTNLELKTMMLDYAFKTFNQVWFHISPINIRSQRAAEKIGARFIEEKITSICGSTPTLTQFYRIDKQHWVK